MSIIHDPKSIYDFFKRVNEAVNAEKDNIDRTEKNAYNAISEFLVAVMKAGHRVVKMDIVASILDLEGAYELFLNRLRRPDIKHQILRRALELFFDEVDIDKKILEIKF